MRRMREDREAAGPVNETNCVGDGEAFLRDVRRTTVAEIPVERVTKIDSPPFGDHRSGDMRPPNRPTTGLLQNRLEVDPNAQFVETAHDSRGTRATHIAKRREL